MQRYFSKEKKNNYLLLSNEDLYHINKVMRMKEHDEIEVIYDETLYICELEKTQAKIKEKLDINNEINKEIVLVIPLLKEQKMDLVLQKATELGVSKIIPLITERSIVNIDSKKEIKKLERWSRICKEASEQSKRNRIPLIDNIKTIKELNEDGVKIVCSTIEKEKSIKNFLQSSNTYDKMVIVVGPEGGLTDKEEKELNNMGYTSLTLGKRIMRVETVPIFLLSILNYEFME